MSAFTPSGIVEDSVMEKMRPPGVAMTALHGTIDGSLEDCMVGCFAPSDADWKLWSLHMNERLNDARVLAVLEAPTRANPSKSLRVKWFNKDHAVTLAGVVQQRDFLMMEATGCTRSLARRASGLRAAPFRECARVCPPRHCPRRPEPVPPLPSTGVGSNRHL